MLFRYGGSHRSDCWLSEYGSSLGIQDVTLARRVSRIEHHAFQAQFAVSEICETEGAPNQRDAVCRMVAWLFHGRHETPRQEDTVSQFLQRDRHGQEPGERRGAGRSLPAFLLESVRPPTIQLLK